MHHPSSSSFIVALSLATGALCVTLRPVLAATATAATANAPAVAQPEKIAQEKIEPYVARFGRSRPLVVVVGENSGTELSDYVIPYAVLAQSGAAEVMALATSSAAMTMRPALHIAPQASTAEFDERFPQGADYVIVPAVVKRDDPTLLAFIAGQGAKGATVVSICDGALVVANSGLLKGHRGTAHWATQSLRAEKYPDTEWLANRRYVADGKVVSSAGISAAVPTALALVEAIAGQAKAGELAAQLGVGEWGSAHDSARFHPRFGVNLLAFVHTQYSNRWLHARETVGVPLAAGVDDIALAFTADAYSRTGRSQAYGFAASNAPVRTRHGLMILPERFDGGTQRPERILRAPDGEGAAATPDKALAAIAADYGRSTAYGVALDFEYPAFAQ